MTSSWSTPIRPVVKGSHRMHRETCPEPGESRPSGWTRPGSLDPAMVSTSSREEGKAMVATDGKESDARPSHRVRDHVLALINGGLAPHAKLPTERELADELDVSRVTVRRVLGSLAAESVIYRIQGSGTFVRPHRIAKAMELTSFSEDMRSRGLVSGSL